MRHMYAYINTLVNTYTNVAIFCEERTDDKSAFQWQSLLGHGMHYSYMSITSSYLDIDAGFNLSNSADFLMHSHFGFKHRYSR